MKEVPAELLKRYYEFFPPGRPDGSKNPEDLTSGERAVLVEVMRFHLDNGNLKRSEDRVLATILAYEKLGT